MGSCGVYWRVTSNRVRLLYCSSISLGAALASNRGWLVLEEYDTQQLYTEVAL